MQTLQVISALLSYPEEGLQEALGIAEGILDIEGLVQGRARDGLDRLIGELRDGDLWELQERYVALFDRQRSLSLHIYEHVHGESRDRGQAMVGLAQVYRLHGLEISARELPDYVPLFLEFLSTLPAPVARGYLADALHVIGALKRRLEERGCAYAAAFAALEAVAEASASDQAVREVLAQLPDQDDTPEALDRRWEEEAVRFVAGTDPQAAPMCGR